MSTPSPTPEKPSRPRGRGWLGCTGLLAVALALWMTPSPLAHRGAAQEPAGVEVLTDIRQIQARAGTNGRVANAVARVQAVITFPSVTTRRLYLQAGDIPIQAYMSGPVDAFRPGQRVELSGGIEGTFLGPRVLDGTARVIEEGVLPEPVPATARRLYAGDLPWRLATVRGVVRDVTVSDRFIQVLATSEGLYFEVVLPGVPGFRLPEEWVDAEVELRGFSSPQFTASGHPNGFRFNVYSTNDVRVVSPGVARWADRPLLSIAEAAARPEEWRTRHRIQGTVLIQRPSGVLYLDDGTGVMLVILGRFLTTGAGITGLDREPQLPLQPGDRIEVVGARHNWYSLVPTLIFSEYRRIGKAPLPPARPVSASEVRSGRHAGQVVSLEARLLNHRGWGNGAGSHELIMLQAGDDVINGSWDSEASAVWNLPIDAHVRVTGVLEAEGGSVKGRPTVQLLLRSPADVVTIPAPAFWTQPQFRKPAVAALSVAALSVGWIVWQRRQMFRLRSSEERFRTLIEHSFDATMVVDAEGGVRYLSPSARRLLGLPSGVETLGRERWAAMVHPADLPRVAEAQSRVVAAPGTVCQVPDYRIVAADGSVRHAEAIGKNCLDVPGVEGVVLNIRDITDRREAENELARRQAAEASLKHALEVERELSQLKNSFVSMVSHEFRTPLEVILSSSNILDRYLDRLSPERRATQLRAIRRSVQRMNDLIDDVLMLAKFDGGALTCAPVALDLGAFCQRVVNEIESATGREGVVRLTVGEALAGARADEGLLHHILTNLLSNAVKYSPEGEMVRFSVCRQGGEAEFRVEDRGRGIPAGDQPRLFNSFHRGSNVGQVPGSGLGLAITRRCVDLHGGRIDFTSAENQGTTFRCRLPLFGGTPPPGASPESQSQRA